MSHWEANWTPSPSCSTPIPMRRWTSRMPVWLVWRNSMPTPRFAPPTGISAALSGTGGSRFPSSLRSPVELCSAGGPGWGRGPASTAEVNGTAPARCLPSSRPCIFSPAGRESTARRSAISALEPAWVGRAVLSAPPRSGGVRVADGGVRTPRPTTTGSGSRLGGASVPARFCRDTERRGPGLTSGWAPPTARLATKR